MPSWPMPSRSTARFSGLSSTSNSAMPTAFWNLSSDSCARLVIEHMPERNFADSGRPFDIPLRIAWRVGDDGLLVHGNHYHPVPLRPKAFAHPLRLTIDPVDSRFIDRTSLEMGRFISSRMRASSAWRSTTIRCSRRRRTVKGAPRLPRFALWLWGYWGRLRGRLFRSPVRFGSLERRDEWERTEAAAGFHGGRHRRRGLPSRRSQPGTKIVAAVIITWPGHSSEEKLVFSTTIDLVNLLH